MQGKCIFKNINVRESMYGICTGGLSRENNI